ncbi:MAG: thymidine phosphorylase [Treponema sp.]|nr:thymidine phosphorylase [Candidatus Treponema equifaecale]
MRAIDIIMKKRGTKVRDANGNQILASSTTLTKEEIKFLIDEYTAGRIPDYQMSAFTMAVYFNGMNFEETGALTDAMLHSGDVIELHGKDGLPENEIYVDKHSTGGVGDKISLPLAPIVAACGVMDPMMSGRALGHTGGTLDKLESIEGFNVNLTEEQFRAGIKKDGFAMMGQTPNVAPADKKMYALRDVTATVESVPLITSSILSKKVAEGADALVFDVKYGSGAFMKTIPDSEELATFLVKTAQAMGKKATAFMTAMNTPLGRMVGNFLEIEETVECLQGKGPADVMELTYALGAEMVLLAGKAESEEEARKMCEDAVSSGKALEIFLANVKTQGGNPEKLMAEIGKRRSQFHTQVLAEKDGYIKLDAFKTGLASVYLGVGRNKSDDKVCPDAGIIMHKKTGDCVKKGELILDVYGKDEACLPQAVKMLTEEALSYSETKPHSDQLIYKIIK